LVIFIIVLALVLLFVVPGAFAAIDGYGCYNYMMNGLGGPGGWGCW